MASKAPPGRLRGNELGWAIKLLTDKQLRAYQYRREGHAWNWIATRMGVTRPAVIHLVAKAEKKLGYEPTVTAKQKTPYKSVAERQAEAEAARVIDAANAFFALSPEKRRLFIRRALPDAPKHIDAKAEVRFLSKILIDASDDPEARERMRKRVAPIEQRARRERRAAERRWRTADADHQEDYSRAVGDENTEFAATLEADFGVNPQTGDPMRANDFSVDDGKGYDVL